MNGATHGSNNMRIDGASQYNIWLPHMTAYVPALESIETVNITTNSFDAEQGLAAGAAVNVQIKSGTNDMHGSAFEYHQDNELKAKPFFLPQSVRISPNSSTTSSAPPLEARSRKTNSSTSAVMKAPPIASLLRAF